MEKTQNSYATMLSLFAELILDHSMKQYRKTWLYKEIDLALDSKDSHKFYELTEKLKAIG